MPKEFSSWQCCKCGNCFDTEEKAAECENGHVFMDEPYMQKYIIGGHVPDELFFIGSDKNRYVYRFKQSLGQVLGRV